MSVLGWIVLGLLAGWIASHIVDNHGKGPMLDMVLGIVGALVGGKIFMVLGAAPGFTVDSSADANRLYQTRTPAYRWLVNNAGRFGFVNYPFEPWHWEWTGESP